MSVDSKQLDNWLNENIGFEQFKGGFDKFKVFSKPLISKIIEAKVSIITIAGTNGKGETAHSLNHLFSSDNEKVGLFTSPHVLSVCERFQFGEEHISEEELLSEFKLCLEDNREFDFSYFEFLYTVFLRLCLKKKVSFIVQEVGLGGRLDATNILDAHYVGLTSIARDHQEVLGKSLKKILREKLGVVKEHSSLVTALTSDYLNNETKILVKENKVLFLGEVDKKFQELDFSQKNQRLAKELYKQIMGKEKEIFDYKRKAFFEKNTYGAKHFLFVGAHNLEGMRELLEKLERDKITKSKLVISFSKRPTKEIRHCVELWKSYPCLVETITISVADHPKLLKMNELQEALHGIAELDFKAISESFDEDSHYLVCGSYYFIGEVQKFLSNHFSRS